jgi:secreted Zn-dependent insulinase-like peptidase
MKLVILGRGTLDELQTVVENTFGSIRANNGLGIDSSHDASNDLRSLHPSEIVFFTENSHYGISAFHSSKNLGVITEKQNPRTS